MRQLMSCLLVVCCGSLASCVGAPPGRHSDPWWRQLPSYQLVKSTPGFYGSTVGFAGETPPVVRAIRGLVVQDEAREILLDLSEQATPPGKLYALAGLFHVDREAHDRLADELAEDATPIEAMRGCLVSDTSVAGVAGNPSLYLSVVNARLEYFFGEREFDFDRYREVCRNADTWIPILAEEMEAADLDTDLWPQTIAFLNLGFAAPELAIQHALELCRSDNLAARIEGAEILLDLPGIDQYTSEILGLLVHPSPWQRESARGVIETYAHYAPVGFAHEVAADSFASRYGEYLTDEELEWVQGETLERFVYTSRAPNLSDVALERLFELAEVAVLADLVERYAGEGLECLERLRPMIESASAARVRALRSKLGYERLSPHKIRIQTSSEWAPQWFVDRVFAEDPEESKP